MANIMYVGFPGDELRKIKSIIYDAERIVRASEYSISSWDSRARLYYKKWFGEVVNNDTGQVPNVLSKMLNCLTSGKFKLTYDLAADCDGDTYAAAAAGDKPETYDAISKGADFEMTICPKMWDLKRYKETEEEADTQVLTFIHELSHLAGGTDDEPHPSQANKKAYGKQAAITLAKNNSTSARNNADNYAFFCKDLAHFSMMGFG